MDVSHTYQEPVSKGKRRKKMTWISWSTADVIKSHSGLHVCESSYLSAIFIYDSDTESGYKLIDCPVIYVFSGQAIDYCLSRKVGRGIKYVIINILIILHPEWSSSCSSSKSYHSHRTLYNVTLVINYSKQLLQGWLILSQMSVIKRNFVRFVKKFLVAELLFWITLHRSQNLLSPILVFLLKSTLYWEWHILTIV